MSRTTWHRERHGQRPSPGLKEPSPLIAPLPASSLALRAPFLFCWVEAELLRYVPSTTYGLRLVQKRDFLLAKKALDGSPAVPRKAGTIPPTGLRRQGKLKWLLCKLQLTAAARYRYSKLGLTPCAGSLHPSCPPNP